MIAGDLRRWSPWTDAEGAPIPHVDLRPDRTRE